MREEARPASSPRGSRGEATNERKQASKLRQKDKVRQLAGLAAKHILALGGFGFGCGGIVPSGPRVFLDEVVHRVGKGA